MESQRVDSDDKYEKYSNQQSVSFQATLQALIMLLIIATIGAVIFYIRLHGHNSNDPTYIFLFVLTVAMITMALCLAGFWNFKPINHLVVLVTCYLFGLTHTFVFIHLLKNVNKIID